MSRPTTRNLRCPAEGVTQTILDRIEGYDMAIINYANPDMVGHTGSVPAAIKAVEVVDDCVRRVVEKVIGLGGKLPHHG